MERRLVGRVGVDSARIIVCDPSYIQPERIGERQREIEEAQFVASTEARARGDTEAVGAAYPLSYTLDFLRGHDGAAVVVHSGIGDGHYPVYAWFDELENWGERIVRLEVDFMDHPWLEVVPIEPPDALKRLLDDLIEWLPKVEGEDSADYLRRVRGIAESYNPQEE